jgi:hypothetical protein
MHTLSSFDDHDVVETTVRITGAGTGLQDALDVAPVELHVGDQVHIVLRGQVSEVRHVPVKNSDDLRRIHVISTSFGTIVDSAAVAKVLDAQRKAIDKAKGVSRLPGVDGDEDGE